MSDANALAGIAAAIERAAGECADYEYAMRDAADLRACVSVFRANEARNDRLYRVYEGKVGLHNLPAYVPDRYKTMHLGCPWPEIAVQSVVERSRFGKFVFPEGSEEAADKLSEIADRCDLAAGYQSGLTDALIAGVSFVAVVRDEVGASLRWHTARSAAGVWDYAHGRLKCGFAIVDRARKRSAASGDEHTDTVPSKVDFYTERGCWELTRSGREWEAAWLPDDMGEPRMLALTFRPDGSHPLGRSRFTEPMRGIVQEYMANALNLHVASEYTALGQKWVTGLTDAQYDALAESKWKFNADNVVLLTDNPSSAEAIYAENEPLVKKCEGFIEQAKVALGKVCLAAIATEEGTTYADAEGTHDVSVLFANPASPQMAQRTDASIKVSSVAPYFSETKEFWRMNGYDDESAELIQRQMDKAKASQMAQQAAMSAVANKAVSADAGDAGAA